MKSRREELMAPRYEIALGSQAFSAMLPPVKPLSTAIPLTAPRLRPWWLWPNLLSLDAPAVAVVWQELWAQCLAADLTWTHRALLALAIWLAYCGDRLLDARRLSGPVDSPRHEFARRHWFVLKNAWLVGFVGVVVLGLQLTLREIFLGAALITVVGGYFVLHHWRQTRARAGAAKEVMAGLVFGVGAVFIVVIQIRFSVAVALALAGWVCLCATNCLAIACWDRARDAAMGQPSLARCWGGADRWRWLGPLAVVTLATLAWVMDARLGPVAAALFLGGLALGEIGRWGQPSDCRRVLADAVLLVPILFLL